MAQILEVTAEATLHAVRRQLSQWRMERVALLLPESWHELENSAQMRLLQRQAQIQLCHLGIITRNPAVRAAAEQVGVPVFVYPEEALRDNWRMSPMLPLVHPRRPELALPETPRWRRERITARETLPSQYRARQKRIRAEETYRRPLPGWLRLAGNLFMGGVMATALILFTLYVIPAATITLVPGREPISVTVQLVANPLLDVPDLEINQLPARLVETNVDESGTIRTSGTRQKSTDLAAGRVTFTNLGTSPVRVPAGTVVSTGTGTAVNFRTTTDADVPAGRGQRADASIEAMEPGIQGNVRANTINTVNGGLRVRVSVSNQGGTGGGGSQLVPIATQQDRDQLLTQVQAQIKAEAYTQLQGLLDEGEWLSPESIQLITLSTPSFSAFNDEEADELSLTLRQLVRGVAVDEAVLRDALVQTAQDAIPPDAKLVASSVVAQRAPGVDFLLGTVQFTMTVNAEYVIPIDPVEVRSAIAGLTPDAAIALVQQRWPMARVPEIYRDPEWFTTLPAIGNRIQVRVAYDDTVNTP
ncbi:MAG: baseplate J/gp47 family protein [Caldilineaceae bacterium]